MRQPPMRSLPAAEIEAQRIQVIGSSGSGKSTLGERLGALLDLPVIELDALNWEADWLDLSNTVPEEFERRLRLATASPRWIVAGSYSRFTQPILWPHLDLVIWLDLPLWLLLTRIVARSWRRWRSGELLWGTNRERFWPLLRLWAPNDSLLAYTLLHHRERRVRTLERMRDPRHAHIRFVRLTEVAEVEAFLRRLTRPPE